MSFKEQQTDFEIILPIKTVYQSTYEKKIDDLFLMKV